MRSLIISVFILFSCQSTYSNTLNSDLFQESLQCESREIKYNYESINFNIEECSCDCSMEENAYKISDSSFTYYVSSISKVIIDGNIIGENSDVIDYFTKDTPLCSVHSIDNNGIYFLSRVPNNENGYCYSVDAYAKDGIFKKYYDELEYKVTSTIKVNKQYLFDNPSDKNRTEMYLIENDKINILDHKGNYFKIKFEGKKIIIAWVPMESIILTTRNNSK
jgi:hypothetical protein